MRAKIKRILVLILVCTMLVNSDMAYLAMGIDMLFVQATENDAIDNLADDDVTIDDEGDSADTSLADGKKPEAGEQMQEPDTGNEDVQNPEGGGDEDIPDNSDTPVTPETPEDTDIPESPDVPEDTPENPEMPDNTDVSDTETDGETDNTEDEGEVKEPDASEKTENDTAADDEELPDMDSLGEMAGLFAISPFAITTSNIPTTVEELEAKGSKGYTLSSYQDLVNLQKLSQVTSLEGYTFTFLRVLDEKDEKVWNFSQADVDGQGYIGIGNKDFPFKGTLENYIDGVVFNINRPVCNYVSTGSNFVGMEFDSNKASAAISEYLVTEEGSQKNTVTFKNIEVGGVIGHGAMDVAGGLFARVENKTTSEIVLEFGENSDPVNFSVKIATTSVKASNAGGIIGVVNKEADSTGPVRIINHISVITGSISGQGTATGGIVGYLGPNAHFTMDVPSFKATVNGNGENGGVIGLLDKATFLSEVPLTLSASVSSGNNKSAGGLVGKANDARDFTIKNVTIQGTVVTAGSEANADSKAGGILGFWSDVTDRENPSVFENISLKSSAVVGYAKGGIIGSIAGNNVSIDTVSLDAGTRIGTATVTNGWAGGVVGNITGHDIEIKNVTVGAYNIFGWFRGGVIGGLLSDATGTDPVTYKTKARVTNALVTANLGQGSSKVTQAVGGILGRAERGSVLSLCGDISVQSSGYGSDTNKGYIAGEVDTALVYFEDDTVRDYFETNKTAVNALYDNVGNYGGIWTNSDGLINYAETGSQIVKRTIEGLGTAENPYKINTKEELMCLAIALNTDGAFGADSFKESDTTYITADRAGAKKLRSAHYLITNSIDLKNTGTYTLSRNDKYTAADTAEYAFKGNITGADTNVELIMDSHDTNQTAIGLFPLVQGATFKNLIIKTRENSPWRYAKSAAGIAPYAYGDLTLEEVKSYVHLTARQETASNLTYHYGALVGRMELSQTYGYTVNTKNILMAATIDEIRATQYVGGLASYVTTGNNAVVPSMGIEGTTTISNQFIFTGNYTQYTNGTDITIANSRMAIAGGLIGRINTGNVVNVTRLKLTADEIVVENQILDYSTVTNMQGNAVNSLSATQFVGAGGFIAHKWDNIEADFEKITVKGENTKLLAPSSRTGFGGLFGIMTGKLYLHDVDLQAGEFANPANYSALLVGHGRWLLCMLDKYTINKDNVKITNVSTYFDEIMGHNATGDYGGILSIKSEGFRDMSSSGYVNQVLPVDSKNGSTRYYYNLFEQGAYITTAEGTRNEYTPGMFKDNIIDTPAKMMVWHLYSWGTAEIRRFITPYFGTGTEQGINNVNRKISGTIDLKGYSFYPTPRYYGMLEGINNAQIIFHGDAIAQIEAGKRPASSGQHQNYRMHSGLIYTNANTKVTSGIKNMTLSGSITNMSTASGAVVTGGYCYGITIQDVTLKNLHITNYNGTTHKMGLLLAGVNDNASSYIVNISGIRMDYDEDVYGTGKYAAAALIGYVGSNTSKNIVISFSDMQMPYVKAGKTASEAPVKTESPLRYASFIDYYDYTSDTDTYKGLGIYQFDKAEYTANTVTLGQEIHYGLQYNDVNESLPQNVLDEAEDNYLPYVCVCVNEDVKTPCSKVTIQVNPKRGDLLEGCGTYEDPYVIKNGKQLFQLYLYLSPKSVSNDKYLTSWKVNQFGLHNADDSHVQKIYGEENFPTRDELRTAYYVVTADIDLNAISDVSDSVVSNDFDGIGSSEYPFAGVIYGKTGTESIILPGNENKRAKTNFGLFNIIKGAVVKDLTLTTMVEAEGENKTNKDDILINQYGGSVAGRVIGGDNVIDNVKVTTKLMTNQTTTIVGGYVGVIEKGGVVIRNITTDDLTGFMPKKSDNQDNTSGYVSAIAGKVQDGYLIYEGLVNGVNNTDKKVLTAGDFGFTEGSLELSKTFHMVNGNYLDKMSLADKIVVTVDDTAKTTSVVLKNDAHLEIIALLLNAEGLSSISTINKTNYNAYDTLAVCRKAKYTSMGTSGSTDGTVATEDAIYNLPYLMYKYFTVDGADASTNYSHLYHTADTVTTSKFNKMAGVTDYTTTYSLENGIYDMTEYKYGFRGLGELYDTTTGNTQDVRYAKFNANFNGNGSTVIADMNVDYDTALLSVGLFNDLDNFSYCKDYTAADAQYNTIENMVIKGTFSNTNNTAVTNKRAGAVAGSIYGNWTFSNITLKELKVEADLAAGGLVGKIMNDDFYKSNATVSSKIKFAYRIQGCEVETVQDADGNEIRVQVLSQESASGGAGGFIGTVSTQTTNSDFYGGIIECTNCVIDGLSVRSEKGAVGGIIGDVGIMVESELNFTGNTLSNMEIVSTGSAGYSAGGIIGKYSPIALGGTPTVTSHHINMTDNTVKDSVLTSLCIYTTSSARGVGGMIGLINLTENATYDANTFFAFSDNTIVDVTLGKWVNDDGFTTITAQPVGGLIGYMEGNELEITDCVVKNTLGSSAEFVTLGTDIGGLVGMMRAKTCIVDYSHTEDFMTESESTGGVRADIENLKMTGQLTYQNPAGTKYTNQGTRIGGLFGTTTGRNSSLTISDIKVKNCLMTTDTKWVDNNIEKYAVGGLVGVINSVYNGNKTNYEINLNNVLVTGSEFTGYAAGGITGSNRLSTTDGYNILAQNMAVRNCYMLAAAAGGVFGGDYAAGTAMSNNYKNILVEHNKIGGWQGSYTYVWAGGFTGIANVLNRSANSYYNEIKIKDNVVVGYASELKNLRVGGMIGIFSNGASGYNTYIYEPILEDNHIGVWIEGTTAADGTVTQDTALYTMANLKNITETVTDTDGNDKEVIKDDKIGILYAKKAQTYEIVQDLPATMTEKDIQHYAGNVGSLVGRKFNGFKVYVLKPQISFDTDIVLRPVVDCGTEFVSANAGISIDGSYSIKDGTYPYSYEEDMHVVYFDAATAVTEGSVQDDIRDYMSGISGNPAADEYLLDEIESIQSAYREVDNKKVVDTQKLLDTYRLNQWYQSSTTQTKLTLMNLYDKSYYNGSSEQTVISNKGVTSDLIGIPMVVYDTENGSPTQVIYSFISMLTNGGGSPGSGVSGIFKMTGRKAYVKDSVITLAPASEKASLIVRGTGINYNHYDTYDEEKGTTITLLEMSYGWTTGTGETVRETYYIPVYVLERLDVTTFIRMKEGAVYSYASMQDSANTVGDGTNERSVIMANDTTYTMAVEFLYGSGRKKFKDETVDKVFKLEQKSVSGSGNSPKALPVGTKLTLIDVETGYSYYYEATAENQAPILAGTKDSISFTEFVRVPGDETLGKYENHTMHQIDTLNSDTMQQSYESFEKDASGKNQVFSDVGIERYLLVVDGSESVAENASYEIIIEVNESSKTDTMDIYPTEALEITSIPGLQIGFEGKGNQTTIAGQMMRHQEVVINAVYSIEAPLLSTQEEGDMAPYWTMASSGKVMDSANNNKFLELAIYLQDEFGNRITLPQNTRISMNGKVMTANGSQSVFYYYKDTGNQESLNNLTSDKEWSAQIRLGFDTAILDSYNDEYSVVIELLRTDDANYPMSGDKPDYYGDEITAHIQNDLAVAILADDLITLGINTYMEETHQYEIPCTSMIDFGSVIEFELQGSTEGDLVVEKQLERWCDNTRYEISYRLYKKVYNGQNKEYVQTSTDRISLWKKDDSAEGGYSAFQATTDSNGHTVYKENRTYDKDDVRLGSDGTSAGLMTNNLLLKVNTEDIEDIDLSNYKLEMSVVAYDKGANLTGQEAVLKDFFIFTISKLKTDME